MKTKIIELLKLNEDHIITGTDIAKKLNITRSYVSKVVALLKDEGYNIEIINRSGYIYHDDYQVINIEKISKRLTNKDIFTITVLDKVNSTNTYLKELTSTDNTKIQVVIANEQTNGVGRMSRHFVSNRGKGIYMSIRFKPNFSLETTKKVTACVSVAIAKAIDNLCNTNVSIKWVNDIYINNKKICGILSTGSTNLELGILDYMIVGIGINLYHQEFPEELKDIASSIYDETKVIVDRSNLIGEVLNEILKALETIETNDFITTYRNKSNVIGHMVELSMFDHTEIVKVLDIDDDAKLVVEKDGKIKKIYSGEIQRMRLKIWISK